MADLGPDFPDFLHRQDAAEAFQHSPRPRLSFIHLPVLVVILLGVWLLVSAFRG